MLGFLGSQLLALVAGCTTLACPTAGANCDQMLGPPSAVGEDALLGYAINAGTGNLYLSATDISVQPALGPPLVFARHYNSQGWSGAVGAGYGNLGLGVGWTHTYSWFASANPSNANQVRIVTDTGRAIYFNSANQNGAAPWTAQVGEFGSLGGGFSTGFTYTDKFGTQFQFDNTTSNYGRLLSIAHADNSTPITVTYGNGGSVPTAVTSGDKTLTFYSPLPGHLSVSDPVGNVWSYVQDSNGNLVTVVLPNLSGSTNGEILYGYGSLLVNGRAFSNGGNVNQLTSIQVEQSANVFNYSGLFSYSGGELVEADSGVAGPAFLRDVQLSYSLCQDANSTTDVNLNGGFKAITSSVVAGVQRIASYVAAAGSGSPGEWSSGSYSWSPSLELNSVTDGNHVTTAFQGYDGLGNPQTIVEASGTPLARTTSVVWHPLLSRPLSISRTSVDGTHSHQVVFDYDSDYNTTYNQAPTNLVHQVVQIGQTDTSMSGTLNGTVTETTQVYYDSSNRLSEVLRPAFGGGQTATLYHYYALSNEPTSNRLYHASVQIGPSSYLTWEDDKYDANGRVTAWTDPNLVYHTAAFDQLGHLTQASRSQNGSQLTDGYAYDLAGELLSHTTPEGTQILQQFDSGFRLALRYAQTAGASPTVPWSRVFDYDAMNHVLTERRFEGLGTDEGVGCTTTGTEERCLDRSWDRFERLQTVRTLDSNNQVCAGSSCQVQYAYDGDGNLQAITEAGLNQTTYTRDPLGRVTQITLPTGKYSTVGYDLDDDVTWRRDPKDSLNGGSGGSRLVTYLYDDFGNRIDVASPDMGSWVYNYDGANQIAEAKDANGNLMQYQYDLGGRITAMNSSVTNQSLAYLYDKSCALT